MSAIIFSCGDESVKPVQEGKIVGYILDNRTLLPIANALVYSEPPTESVITNEEGYFYLGSTSPGDYRILASSNDHYPASINVHVKEGKESRAFIKLFSKADQNQPPDIPIISEPKNGGTIRRAELTVNWTCEDPDGDKLTYDVYFDTSNPPAKTVANKTKFNSLQLNNLTDSTTYYLKVVAYDLYEAPTESEIISFKVMIDGKIPENILLMHFPFDGIVNDIGPYLTQVNVSNLAFVNDRHGNESSAAYFNGASSLITVPPASSEIGDNYTIMFWCYLDENLGLENKSKDIEIFSKWGAATVLNASYVFYIYNKNSFVFRTCQGNDYSNNLAVSLPAKKTWFHVAITGNSVGTSLFINGVLTGSKNNMFAQKSNLNLQIGGSLERQTFFKGAIDDLIFFNKSLSLSEIEEYAKLD